MPTSHRYQLSLKALLLVVLNLSVGLMASVKPGSEFGTSVFELALDACCVRLYRRASDANAGPSASATCGLSSVSFPTIGNRLEVGDHHGLVWQFAA